MSDLTREEAEAKGWELSAITPFGWQGHLPSDELRGAGGSRFRVVLKDDTAEGVLAAITSWEHADALAARVKEADAIITHFVGFIESLNPALGGVHIWKLPVYEQMKAYLAKYAEQANRTEVSD